MELRRFIEECAGEILAEWDAFARELDTGGKMGLLALRDHAAELLRAVAEDMGARQSELEREAKSRGGAAVDSAPAGLDAVSKLHALGRVASGFDLAAVVSEYRALRASVLKLWARGQQSPGPRDLSDVTRFNEAVDQSLAEAVRSYTRHVGESTDMFLAMLGHDLRTPLNSISMLADLVRAGPAGGEDPAGAAGQISASVGNMSRMISDLLLFAGTRLGVALQVFPEPMDLCAGCKEVVREARAAHPGVAIELDCAGDLAGRWDGARLHQALSNLVGNAVQHGTKGRPVHVVARGTPSEVVVSVRNGGAPIPEELMPAIFSPLVQGTSEKMRKHRRPGSMGLGLYIVREIATAHRGTVSVESLEEAGTIFTLRLPRVPPTVAAVPAGAA